MSSFDVWFDESISFVMNEQSLCDDIDFDKFIISSLFWSISADMTMILKIVDVIKI